MVSPVSKKIPSARSRFPLTRSMAPRPCALCTTFPSVACGPTVPLSGAWQSSSRQRRWCTWTWGYWTEAGSGHRPGCPGGDRGQWDDQFVVDPFQAGAGTSHNMNANEVIANRANQILGYHVDDPKTSAPNDQVNMAQSTNDTIPTLYVLAACGAWMTDRRGLPPGG